MDSLLKRLQAIDQEHLYAHLLLLSKKEQNHLLEIMQQAKLTLSLAPKRAPITEMIPLKKAALPSQEDLFFAEAFLEKGQVALCLLAGGMGTRLKFDGPKGCFPITPVSHRSLFALTCDKIKAAQAKYHHSFFLLIMTSSLNHEQTQSFFEKNQFFGLEKKQVHFFTQSMLPFCDEKEKFLFFFQDQKHLAMGPAGNGSFFSDIKKSSMLAFLEEHNILHLQILNVDNPLADPFDPALIGTHIRNQNEVTLTVIKDKLPDELLGGLIVDQNKKIRIVEYCDLPKEKNLSLHLFNTGIYIVSLSFIQRFHSSLFLHPTIKETLRYDGKKQISTRACKYESFIFEAFDAANTIGVLLKDRKSCFSPLKNQKGPNSIKTVQKDLQIKERALLEQYSFCPPVKGKMEIDSQFYYPTKEFLLSCKKTYHT